MSGAASGEQELRAEQPDAVGAGVEHGGHVVEPLEIGVEPDGHAVGRHRRPARPSPSGPGRLVAPVGLTLGPGDVLSRRRQIDLAGGAVDDHGGARPDATTRFAKADDRRYLQRPGEDRGVMGAAAGVGGEAEHPRPVELCRQRGGQLVGDEHDRAVELAQRIGGRAVAGAAQVHPHAAGDVGDVAVAFAQVRILDRSEHLAQLLVGPVHRPRRVDPLGLDQFAGPAEEHRVVEDEQLGVEERRQVVAGAVGQPIADLGQLGVRAPPRRLQRLYFLADALGRNRKAHDFGALGEDDGAADGDAGRDAEPGQSLHVSSPNPVRTSAASDDRASASSMPSALMVITAPRAAASSRIPMMLLPSTCRPSRVTRTLAR